MAGEIRMMQPGTSKPEQPAGRGNFWEKDVPPAITCTLTELIPIQHKEAINLIGKKMPDKDLVKYHIYESMIASILEMRGDEASSHRLKAEIKSRFINMSNEELWELALLTSSPPERTVVVYQRYKETRDKLKETTSKLAK